MAKKQKTAKDTSAKKAIADKTPIVTNLRRLLEEDAAAPKKARMLARTIECPSRKCSKLTVVTRVAKSLQHIVTV